MAYETSYGLGSSVAPVDPSTFLYETDEERRRRLAREAAAQGQPPAEQPALGSGLRMPAPQAAAPGLDYETQAQRAQTNPRVRRDLLIDPNTPPDIRASVADQERLQLQNRQKQLEAQRVFQSGDQNKMAQAMASRDPDGSFLKLLGYKALGMTNLALEEERRLGAGRTTENVVSPDGKSRARITFSGTGQPVSGYDQTGRPLGEQELQAYATYRQDSGTTAGLPQKGEFLVDSKNRPFREVFNPLRPTQPDLVPIGHQDQPEGPLVRSTQSASLAGQVQGGKVIGGSVAEQTGAVPTQVPMMGQQPTAPVAPTAQPQAAPAPQPQAQAAAPVAPAPAPARAPVPQAAPAPAAQPAAAAPVTAQPVAPGQAPALTPTRPTLNPVIGGTAGGQGVVPPGQYKSQQSVRETAAKEAIQTAETEPRENIKLNAKSAAEAADRARTVSRLDRTLDSIDGYTRSHPQFFGNWIGGEAYRAFTAAQTDGERRDALQRLAQVANISPKDRPEFQKLVNEMARVELAGITSSGLSATQLNTEKESARAVKSMAPSITDSPEATRTQVAIAKADIEYQRQWAKFYAAADKKKSPAEIQTEFDAKIGDGIYERLRERLEKEKATPGTAAPGGNRTSTGVQFRIIQQ